MSTALQPRPQNIARLEDSPAHGFMIELKTLKQSAGASKEQFVDLFKRWVEWLSQCDQENDPRGYGASVTLVFSVFHWAQQKISSEEKKGLEKWAAAVIKSVPNIDPLRAEFLKKYE